MPGEMHGIEMGACLCLPTTPCPLAACAPVPPSLQRGCLHVHAHPPWTRWPAEGPRQHAAAPPPGTGRHAGSSTHSQVGKTDFVMCNILCIYCTVVCMHARRQVGTNHGLPLSSPAKMLPCAAPTTPTPSPATPCHACTPPAWSYPAAPVWLPLLPVPGPQPPAWSGTAEAQTAAGPATGPPGPAQSRNTAQLSTAAQTT